MCVNCLDLMAATPKRERQMRRILAILAEEPTRWYPSVEIAEKLVGEWTVKQITQTLTYMYRKNMIRVDKKRHIKGTTSYINLYAHLNHDGNADDSEYGKTPPCHEEP